MNRCILAQLDTVGDQLFFDTGLTDDLEGGN